MYKRRSGTCFNEDLLSPGPQDLGFSLVTKCTRNMCEFGAKYVLIEDELLVSIANGARLVTNLAPFAMLTSNCPWRSTSS